jgi:site-specific recombinase XerC
MCHAACSLGGARDIGFWPRRNISVMRIGPPQQGHGSRTQIYKKTGNLRAVQLLLGHTKMDSTVRYLGVELEDALEISEAIEI